MDDYDHSDEWCMQMFMGIDEVRAMYSHVCYSIEKWPGSPARPAEEQDWLHLMKVRLFAMMQEYNIEHATATKPDEQQSD
tara:strand:- start:5921 stop:6160 length:240 start_codon:yes stop_codon:yes gene_type:complete